MINPAAPAAPETLPTASRYSALRDAGTSRTPGALSRGRRPMMGKTRLVHFAADGFFAGLMRLPSLFAPPRGCP
jgi:hypothetical protein